MQAFIDLLESKKQSKHSKSELKAAFDMYDANLDEKITINEVIKYYEKADKQYTTAIGKFDKN